MNHYILDLEKVMNNFTQKELEYILECVSPDDAALNGGWYREPDIAYRLKDKIKSMIDNYCEHTKIGFLGDVYGYECKDCGADINGHLITDEQHEASMYE